MRSILPVIFLALNAALSAVGLFLVFKKMGIKRWKAFIPFLNTYTLYKTVWEAKYFYMWLLADVIVALHKFNNKGVFAMIIFVFASVVTVFLELKMYSKLAESFGYYIGMALLLFFLTPIMLIFLGISTDKYIGAKKKPIQ